MSCKFCKTIRSNAPSISPSIFSNFRPSLIPSHLSSTFPTYISSISTTRSIIPSISPSIFSSLRPSLIPSHLPSIFPTFLPTHTCKDNINFQDKFGFHCDIFLEILCDELMAVGYSKKETVNVQMNCKKSCRYCPATSSLLTNQTNNSDEVLSNIPSKDMSAFPVSSPSISPLEFQTGLPSVATSKNQYMPLSKNSTSFLTAYPSNLSTQISTEFCHDDPTYSSPYGFPCWFHRSLSCHSLRQIGFTAAEMQELIVRCALSCKACETSKPSNFPSTEASPSPTRIPSFIPSLFSPYLPSTFPTLSLAPTSCQDNPNFINKGFSCPFFSKMPCEKLESIGYSKREIIDIIYSCKKSCGYCSTSPPTFHQIESNFQSESSAILSKHPSPSTKQHSLRSKPSTRDPDPEFHFTTYFPSSVPIIDSNNSFSFHNETELEKGKHDILDFPCKDNLSFRDSLGNSCSAYNEFKCSLTRNDEYLFSQLYRECPKSCGWCNIVSSHKKINPKMIKNVPVEGITESTGIGQSISEIKYLHHFVSIGIVTVLLFVTSLSFVMLRKSKVSLNKSDTEIDEIASNEDILSPELDTDHIDTIDSSTELDIELSIATKHSKQGSSSSAINEIQSQSAGKEIQPLPVSKLQSRSDSEYIKNTEKIKTELAQGHKSRLQKCMVLGQIKLRAFVQNAQRDATQQASVRVQTVNSEMSNTHKLIKKNRVKEKQPLPSNDQKQVAPHIINEDSERTLPKHEEPVVTSNQNLNPDEKVSIAAFSAYTGLDCGNRNTRMEGTDYTQMGNIWSFSDLPCGTNLCKNVNVADGSDSNDINAWSEDATSCDTGAGIILGEEARTMRIRDEERTAAGGRGDGEGRDRCQGPLKPGSPVRLKSPTWSGVCQPSFEMDPIADIMKEIRVQSLPHESIDSMDTRFIHLSHTYLTNLSERVPPMHEVRLPSPPPISIIRSIDSQ